MTEWEEGFVPQIKPEGVKKILPSGRGRAGILEKFYSSTSLRQLLKMKNSIKDDYIQSLVTFAISNDRIYKTLEISLPAQFTEFFHAF